jgi:hypothetical protein
MRTGSLCGQVATSIVMIFAMMLSPSRIGSQLPGTPVLQNAWATPGAMAAINLGGGAGRSVGAVAGSWSGRSIPFVASAGGGYQSGVAVGRSLAYGVRAAVPLVGASRRFGAAAFIGIGGARSNRNEDTLTTVDSVTNSTEVAAGITVGWRHAGGVGRGFSAYITPVLVACRGGTSPATLLRIAVGAEVAFRDRWGVTVGVDAGQNRQRGVGGPAGTRFGVGISHKIAMR